MVSSLQRSRGLKQLLATLWYGTAVMQAQQLQKKRAATPQLSGIPPITAPPPSVTPRLVAEPQNDTASLEGLFTDDSVCNNLLAGAQDIWTRFQSSTDQNKAAVNTKLADQLQLDGQAINDGALLLLEVLPLLQKDFPTLDVSVKLKANFEYLIRAGISQQNQAIQGKVDQAEQDVADIWNSFLAEEGRAEERTAMLTVLQKAKINIKAITPEQILNKFPELFQQIPALAELDIAQEIMVIRTGVQEEVTAMRQVGTFWANRLKALAERPQAEAPAELAAEASPAEIGENLDAALAELFAQPLDNPVIKLTKPKRTAGAAAPRSDDLDLAELLAQPSESADALAARLRIVPARAEEPSCKFTAGPGDQGGPEEPQNIPAKPVAGSTAPVDRKPVGPYAQASYNGPDGYYSLVGGKNGVPRMISSLRPFWMMTVKVPGPRGAQIKLSDVLYVEADASVADLQAEISRTFTEACIDQSSALKAKIEQLFIGWYMAANHCDKTDAERAMAADDAAGQFAALLADQTSLAAANLNEIKTELAASLTGRKLLELHRRELSIRKSLSAQSGQAVTAETRALINGRTPNFVRYAKRFKIDLQPDTPLYAEIQRRLEIDPRRSSTPLKETFEQALATVSASWSQSTKYNEVADAARQMRIDINAPGNFPLFNNVFIRIREKLAASESVNAGIILCDYYDELIAAGGEVVSLSATAVSQVPPVTIEPIYSWSRLKDVEIFWQDFQKSADTAEIGAAQALLKAKHGLTNAAINRTALGPALSAVRHLFVNNKAEKLVLKDEVTVEHIDNCNLQRFVPRSSIPDDELGTVTFLFENTIGDKFAFIPGAQKLISQCEVSPETKKALNLIAQANETLEGARKLLLASLAENQIKPHHLIACKNELLPLLPREKASELDVILSQDGIDIVNQPVTVIELAGQLWSDFMGDRNEAIGFAMNNVASSMRISAIFENMFPRAREVHDDYFVPFSSNPGMAVDHASLSFMLGLARLAEQFADHTQRVLVQSSDPQQPLASFADPFAAVG